jgi:anti-anti-sigma regulatory factor
MTGVPDPVDRPGDVLSEEVDVRAARISARGRLGLRGAELLSATVAQLRRSGARCVVLDLSSVTTAEPAALVLLVRLQHEVATAGARLLLCDPPDPGAPVPPAPARGRG